MWGIEKFQEQWYIVQIEDQLKQWDHTEIWNKKHSCRGQYKALLKKEKKKV